MQLNRLVEFHKTMGDATRLRILSLISNGPLHGQAIAGKLGLTAPTITHHLKKLRDVSVVIERRDKNTIYFHLNHSVVKQYSEAIEQLIEGRELVVKDLQIEDKQKIIANFFTKDGKLKTIPAQRKKKLMVFEHLVKGLEKGRKYEEKEINQYIQNYHEDYATIRREFIINQYMYRENGIYELNPVEMWAKMDD
jgi:biotin operon repressor